MSALPQNWTAYKDPQGRTYYHNSRTNETTWTPPVPYPAPSAPPSGGLYPGASSYDPAVPSHYGSASQGYHAGNPQDTYGKRPQHATYGGGHGQAAATHDALATAHTFSKPMTFVLKEKILSLSGDSFSIKDETGATRYKIEGKILSLREKKTLTDAQGNRLYKMKEAVFSLRARQTIVDATTGAPVVVLRQKSFIPLMGTSTILIWRGAVDEGNPWLSCKGNFLRKKFSITEVDTGRAICSVNRKGLNISNLVFEKDTYICQISAGVNVALMLMLVVAIDEVYRDSSSGHSDNSLVSWL